MQIMTPQERECATERFDRLAMLENTPRDSEAPFIGRQFS
jgi:hypothetical protein